MRKFLIFALYTLSCSVQAQEFLVAENDTTVLTEYNDGRLWIKMTTERIIRY